jgi:hypothetical protein
MTSTQRSYALIILVSLGGTFGYCASVGHWTIQAAFGGLAMLCTSLAAGIAKAPRDAGISDGTVSPDQPAKPDAVG